MRSITRFYLLAHAVLNRHRHSPDLIDGKAGVQQQLGKHGEAFGDRAD